MFFYLLLQIYELFLIIANFFIDFYKVREVSTNFLEKNHGKKARI